MTEPTFPAPIELRHRTVESDWVDYNGHLNMAYYNVLFDNALDAVFDRIGIGIDYVRDDKCSCFTAEAHVTYLHELTEGDPIRITFQLLDWDAKRIHYFEQMYHVETGYLAATSEQMGIHVSMESRRATPFPDHIQARLANLMDAHSGLDRPPQAGHVIGIPRKQHAAATAG